MTTRLLLTLFPANGINSINLIWKRTVLLHSIKVGISSSLIPLITTTFIFRLSPLSSSNSMLSHYLLVMVSGNIPEPVGPGVSGLTFTEDRHSSSPSTL